MNLSGTPKPDPDAQSGNGFSKEELLRYGRHLIMPEVGLEGQQKLSDARVLVIGAGGLGSPASLYLAAAGVGTLGLVDDDAVELTNLQRQILHGSSAVGTPKLASAKARLSDLNPEIEIRTHAMRLAPQNVFEIFEEYDLIVDGSDNFPTRYLVNDACVLQGKPYVYGSVFRFEGQVSVFASKTGPCYRCLYPQPPPPGLAPDCAEGGVLGVLPGVIGTLQATEAVKLIIGKGSPLIGRLLLFDAAGMRFQEVTMKRDPRCPVCGEHPTVTELIDYDEFCGVKPAESREEISVEELSGRLNSGSGIILLDVREPHERAVASIGGTLIPLAQLPGRLDELERSKEIVVYCHTGRRSGYAVGLLRSQGFKHAKNLVGGIDAWARRIDTTMARY